ncbi:MAG: hypothetical protein ACOC4G_03295 [Bacillota bacterium]
MKWVWLILIIIIYIYYNPAEKYHLYDYNYFLEQNTDKNKEKNIS